MSLRLIAYFLATISLSNIAIAAEQTYVREYTYQASEADGKLSARAIALQEVKRELLSELGTHVTALVKVQSASDGTYLGTEKIETLSAGVTRVEILDEKWNGTVYVLKAQIKADPADVLRSLEKMLDADKKQKQVAQLGGELDKMRGENLQMVESLTQSKKASDAAMAEIARLKQQLRQQQDETQRLALQKQYEQQAQQVAAQELFDVGMNKYQEGNYTEASAHWRQAAEQGHAGAQFNLGGMYANGRGVAQDDFQAALWFRKAAEQGDALAQYVLGVMYDFGLVVAEDNRQAAFWYRKAGEQGHTGAQFNLGAMYANGDGVEQNYKQAELWYRKAAELGLAAAQFHLGVIYANGIQGVAQDYKQAAFWYRKAAKQGVAEAQYILGQMYANGQGVAQDDKQAEFWIRKAAEQGAEGR